MGEYGGWPDGIYLRDDGMRLVIVDGRLHGVWSKRRWAKAAYRRARRAARRG